MYSYKKTAKLSFIKVVSLMSHKCKRKFNIAHKLFNNEFIAEASLVKMLPMTFISSLKFTGYTISSLFAWKFSICDMFLQTKPPTLRVETMHFKFLSSDSECYVCFLKEHWGIFKCVSFFQQLQPWWICN